MHTILTIAGSDCSGGAGIQADIKTISAHKMYAMSVITALTAQNTQGVQGIYPVPPSFIEDQLHSIFDDIPPEAIKIGMLFEKDIILSVANKLRGYDGKNIVVDPVMISTSGHHLFQNKASETLMKELMPLAKVITPNLPEAEALWGRPIKTEEDMAAAGKEIGDRIGCAVLVKGGHMAPDQRDEAADCLYETGRIHWFREPWIHSNNTHGTGCTLSSAIACNLAAGCSLPEAVAAAKAYLTGALKADPKLGKGHGPLNHMYR